MYENTDKSFDIEMYKGLANAVVEQAIKDYKALYERYARQNGTPLLKREVEKLELFFVSPLFELYTDGMDGLYIINKIQDEVDSVIEAERQEEENGLKEEREIARAEKIRNAQENAMRMIEEDKRLREIAERS